MPKSGAERWDLIVVGAGPAGSTLATLVKKHSPDARVLILEQEGFPRHHVGESLLPAAVPVLMEMGAYEKIAAQGFLTKIGLVCVWGPDRTPWDASFDRIKFLARGSKSAKGRAYSWHVERARYDAALARHAEDSGVAVRMGVRALKPVERGGAVTGVAVRDTDGTTRELACRTLADCSGQNGFLSKFRPVRRPLAELKNVSAYAYFKGAKWRVEYTGHPDKSAVFICSVPQGWFWYIPLKPDTVSVGLVAKAEYVKKRGVADFRTYFMDALKGCEEIWPLVKDARLLTGMDPKQPAKDFFTERDFSFEGREACGDGWIAAGDAAFFIDPLLSSGVVLAHLSGHRAAYTVKTLWEEKDRAARAAVAADYGSFCRTLGSGFLDLVRYWYGHEPRAAGWWKSAARVLKRRAPYHLTDKDAFISVISGISAHFERAYVDGARYADSDVLREPWARRRIKEERSFHAPYLFMTGKNSSLWREKRGGREQGLAPRAWSEDLVPSWSMRRRDSTRLVPLAGTGLLRPMTEVSFFWRDGVRGERALAGASRVMPRPCVAVLDAIDGERALGQIRAGLLSRFPLPAVVLNDQFEQLLKDLDGLGVIRLKRSKKTPGGPEPLPGPWRAFRDAERMLVGFTHRQAEAERLLTDLLDQGFDHGWVRALRGEARRQAGRFDEALADFDAAERSRFSLPEPARGRLGVLASQFEETTERSWLLDRLMSWREAAARRDASDVPAWLSQDRWAELRGRATAFLIPQSSRS